MLLPASSFGKVFPESCCCPTGLLGIGPPLTSANLLSLADLALRWQWPCDGLGGKIGGEEAGGHPFVGEEEGAVPPCC